MIARTWRGWTRPEDEAAYAAYVASTGLAEYTNTSGNRGAYLLHRQVGDRTEFLAFSLWDSVDSIAAFAGDAIETAVFYPQDDRYLIDRELTVNHYDVVLPAGQTTDS